MIEPGAHAGIVAAIFGVSTARFAGHRNQFRATAVILLSATL
jgi:hypothetical protein